MSTLNSSATDKTAGVTRSSAGRRPDPHFLRYLPASLRPLFRDVAATWRHDGRGAAWKELREWLVFPLFRHGRVVVMEQDIAETPDGPNPPGVEIRRFTGPDWSPLAGIANERTRATFARRVARGRICFVAWRGDLPVGYVWLSERTDPDLELYPLPLPPDAVYGWDVYVDATERGNGIGPALINARLRYARAQGFRTSWRVIAPDNDAMFRAVRKASRTDLRIFGEMRYARVLGRVFARIEPRADPDASAS